MHHVIISDIWIKHYNIFYKFIIDSKKIFNNFDILEIGAGNNYIVNLFLKNSYYNYTILEPVITNKNEGVNYISGWLENYKIEKKFDMVILSHVFEHLYSPKDLFKIKSKYIALSIPNIPKYIDNFILNFLNIEHTYYFEEDDIIILQNNNKYKLINKSYFQNHSIFLLFENDTELKTISYSKIEINTIEKKIDLYFNNIFKLIDNINNYTKLNNKKFAIFPSNMYIQYLICLGLYTNKIQYFYYNNINKLDKYLYGTNIICKNLNFYIENNDYKIILLGFLYNQEIQAYFFQN